MHNIQTQRQVFLNAPSTLVDFLDVDETLFKANPLTLGITVKQLIALLDVISDHPLPDKHLIERLECILVQVTYAHNNPGILDPSLFTPRTWASVQTKCYLRAGKDYAYINPNHYREWLNSGIAPTIILLNFQSLYHTKQIHGFIGVNHNSLGWIQWSVDPLTGLTDTTVAQHFKPDTPYTNSKDRKIKYLCSSKETDKVIEAIFANTGNRNYWKEVIESNCPILITEGFKKAVCGLSNGLPTIALLGTWMGIDKVDKGVYVIKDSLKPFMEGNRVIYLAFDSDIIHKQSVYDAMVVTAKAIQQVPNFTGKVMVPTWNYSQLTKGMDDFIKHEGIEAFRERLERAYTLNGFILEHEGKTSSSAVLERKEAIEQWSKANDPFLRAYLEECIKSKYGYNSNKIQQLASELEALDKINLPFTLSNDELIAEGIPDVEWLTDHYFARCGLSVIYGEAGTGKSFLVYLLMIALAKDSSFLGKNVKEKFKSLIIQMDESKASWGKRMRELGIVQSNSEGKEIFNPTLNPYLNFKLSAHSIWEGNDAGLALLDNYLTTNSVDMVIVDNLKHTLPGDIDLNSVEVESKFLKQLQRLAEKHNCHILILHHTNKEGGFIGSQSIKDSLTYMGHLYRKGNKIVLEDKKQRDGGVHRTVSYNLVPNSEGYLRIANVTEEGATTEGEASNSTNPELTNEQKIIQCLQDIAENVARGKKKETWEFTARSIAEDVGVSKSSVDVTFRKLVKEGVIVKGDKRHSPYTTTPLFNDMY